MKKLIAALKEKFGRKVGYKYVFETEQAEIIERARALNHMAIEMGGHISSISTILSDPNEGFSAETVDRLNAAVREAADEIISIIKEVGKLTEIAMEKSYITYDIKTGKRIS